jgi:hypothetical protein
MLHAAHSWPEFANIYLWPQAVNYEIWIFNNLPSINFGLSPNKAWLQIRCPTENLNRAHTLGCLVYMLDPRLQDSHKIPKWEPPCLGMFVGFSTMHSSLVLLVLKIHTGKILPQYHVIFDDTFQTVPLLPTRETMQQQWRRLFKFPQECYFDVELNSNGFPVNPPPDMNFNQSQ